MPAKKRHATLRKDGRWQCKVQGKTIIDRDRNEAIRKADEYDAQLQLQLVEASRPKTVRLYAGEWLDTHKRGVSDRHHDACANHLDRLVSVCGDMLLSEVRPDDAARVWHLYDGMSASSVRKASQLYRALFDAAIENDYCVKNPFRAKSAQPPKAADGTHRALTPEEISLIRDTPHRLRAAVMVMLYAGLRRGEVIALTSNDIDTKHGVIHVTKAARYDSNQPILDDPKTEAGVRDVPIPDALAPVLKDLTGFVAPSASGGMMTEQAWQRAWESYLDALTVAANGGLHRRWYGRTREHKAILAADGELPPYREIRIRPHDLRHTYCTMLCDAGVPLRQAMEWLGHADEKMILRIYDHNSDARRQQSLDALNARILSEPGVKTGVNQASATPGTA